jgi:hypothetical protein
MPGIRRYANTYLMRSDHSNGGGAKAFATPFPRPLPRVVKELDLFESDHGCGLNVPFQGTDPKTELT